MLSEFPVRALLRFELRIPHIADDPPIDGDVRKWSAAHLVPPLCDLEQQEPFADVYWAWNDHGLYFAFDVPHRRLRFDVDPKQWWKKDGVRLCIDTRDTRDNRRGTRYCHFFYCLPAGGGRGDEPIAGLHRMSRAKEHPPVDAKGLRTAVRRGRRGYTFEVGIPAECLHGWSPGEHPRIGVFYKIKDVQFGSQHLSVPDVSGWNVDPSTWASAQLTTCQR